MHVATSTLDKLLDYVMNTSADGFRSNASVETLYTIIDKNSAYLKQKEAVEFMQPETK